MFPPNETNNSVASLITAKQFASLLKISTRQLHRMRSKGTLIKPIKIGRMTRWSCREVEEWINTGCPSPNQGDNLRSR